MSKKILLLITALTLLLVVLGGGLFIYLYTKNTTPDGTRPSVVETIKKLNPFGEAGSSSLGELVKKILPGNTASSSTSVGNGVAEEALLFKLSNERVSGIDFADVLLPKIIEVRKRILIDNPLAASSSKSKKISVMATSSETIFATSSRIRFVEQGSGHIFEYDYASSTSRKLTNTTIPKTQEAYFLDRGSKVLVRYLDSSNRTIENYLITIPVAGVTSAATGVFLPGSISDISISPSTNEFLYTAKTSTGIVINIYNTKTATERRVSASNFSEWLPFWRGSTVYLQTKAHSSFRGAVYSSQILGSQLVRVLGNISGLTVLPSPNGAKILSASGLALSVFDTKSNTNLPVQGIYTLPEKCVWRSDLVLFCFGQDTPPEGAFPESWYQGKVFFQDALYRIDPASGEAYKLATMAELYKDEIYIDAIQIKVSTTGQLVFINKIDMTPWYLNLDKLLTYF